MTTITKKELSAKRGKSNIIHGTDDNDNITINYNVQSYDNNASNLIHLHNGADNVWIGGEMAAKGGRNTIIGDDGKKNITIKRGMDASKGGTNEILLADNVAHFTAEHYLTIGSVKASHKGENVISTGQGDDKIAFTGHFSARQDGTNNILLSDGSKDVSFAKGMEASYGGKNILTMGVGNQKITFSGDVDTGQGGKNQIVAEGGNSVIDICGDLDAKGINDIDLGGGVNKITIGGNMVAHNKGHNRIVSEGVTTLAVDGAMKGGGLNQIKTGDYNDVLTFQKGLYAQGGSNQIATGDGNDFVTIKGRVTAGNHSTNLIDLGRGNDTLLLNADIAKKDLMIDAGEGYDVLILQAANAYKFKSQYQGWFSDMYQTSILAGTGIEEIRVDIGRGLDLGKIDWLTQMVNQYNASHSDDISLSLALDNEGARIHLGDIFTPRDESSISIIDLTGGNANDLRISDTLSSNGYDGDELRINGDGNDRVSIDGLWSASGGFVHENNNYYHVWNNAYGETLLIQDGIDIHVY